MEPYSYRSDAAVPGFPDDRALIVFDGACVLCSGSAQFVLRHDRHGRFRVAAAQSPLGAALYRHYGLNADTYETNLLIRDGRPWLKSEAVLRIAEALGFPWSLAAAARVLPLRLRDRLYDMLARNRFRLLGRREVCLLGQPGDDRFLA